MNFTSMADKSCLMTPQTSVDQFVKLCHFSCRHGWENEGLDENSVLWRETKWSVENSQSSLKHENFSCEHGRQNPGSNANSVIWRRQQTPKRPPWTCHCWVHETCAGNHDGEDGGDGQDDGQDGDDGNDDDDADGHDDDWDDDDSDEVGSDFFTLGIQQIDPKTNKISKKSLICFLTVQTHGKFSDASKCQS